MKRLAVALLVPIAAFFWGACTSESSGPKEQCTDTSRDVQASHYDQSCNADSDCVGIGIGYSCECETVLCVTTAINASAYAQWKSDVGYSLYVSDVASYPDLGACACPPGIVGASGSAGNACCTGGTCQGCPSTDAGDAGDGASSCGPTCVFEAGSE